jgi:hypothetical protein
MARTLTLTDDFEERGSYYNNLPDGDWEEAGPYRDLIGEEEELMKTEIGVRVIRTYNMFYVWSVGIEYENKKTYARIKVEGHQEGVFEQEVIR